MARRIFAIAITAGAALGIWATAASAGDATPACEGLDVAHDQIHSSGTTGELVLHDLRGHDWHHCS